MDAVLFDEGGGAGPAAGAADEWNWKGCSAACRGGDVDTVLLGNAKLLGPSGRPAVTTPGVSRSSA